MRYIGNKTKLLPFIAGALDRLDLPQPTRALDAFAGTAAVGTFLKSRGATVVGCDLMTFSYGPARRTGPTRLRCTRRSTRRRAIRCRARGRRRRTTAGRTARLPRPLPRSTHCIHLTPFRDATRARDTGSVAPRICDYGTPRSTRSIDRAVHDPCP